MNEATIRSSLDIKVGNLDYSSKPTTFKADVPDSKGPTPGILLIPTSGRNITFDELTTPGLYRIMNLDEDNYVEYGILIAGEAPYTALTAFVPLNEILPGESFVGRFSRNLMEYYRGTGTGTSSEINTFHIRANTAPVRILLEVFEK